MWKIIRNPIPGYKKIVFASADWNEKEAKKLEAASKLYKFRMLVPADENLSIYYLGLSTIPNSTIPLTNFGIKLGCDYIEYKNEKGKWEII